MDHVVDVQRGGEALHGFVMRWMRELVFDVDGEILQLSYNGLVDDLCRRIADNPDHLMTEEPRALRALLAARTMIFLANSLLHPAAELLRLPARPTDLQLVAALFQHALIRVTLPAHWDGKPYTSAPPTLN